MAPRLILSALLTTATLCAQPGPTLEIRGRVIEPNLDIGVAGAEVTLIEFILVDNYVTRSTFAVTYTGTDGAFRFQPLRFGNYYVEVRKEGYTPEGIGGIESTMASVERGVTLTREKPSEDLRFTMIRRGEITGRILDVDGKPVVDVRVVAQQRVKSSSIAEILGKVQKDGSFTIAQVPPGEYFVRISSASSERVRTDFRPEESAVIDQNLETTYWPGGLNAPTGNGLIVSPGALASIGTVTLRTTPHYRVRVSTHGTCPAGQRLLFMASDALSRVPEVGTLGIPNSVTCSPEFLIENVRPGSRTFMLWTNQPGLWAAVPVEIGNRNLELDAKFSPAAEISGRLLAADQTRLPPLSGVRINARALDVFLGQNASASPDEDGNFVMKDVLWPKHSIEVEGLGKKYYVKEIRHNDRPLEGHIIATPGGRLEIVIDDKAAAIAGSVTIADKPAVEGTVAAVTWPVPTEILDSDLHVGRIDDGRFQIDGLAPGEYRVIAVSVENWSRVLRDSTVLKEFASRGESVRLGPSESRTLTLKLLQ